MTVNTNQVTQAVTVLKQYVKKMTDGRNQSSNLFVDGGSDEIHLHISLKKIPNLQHLQSHKIKLPHPLMVDLGDVCLITSDLDKKCPDDENSVAHFSQMLADVGITVGQIIPYHQLKTEYKTHEARRHLARSFQTFLNDGKISKMMPVALGTFFVRKKKMPISVSLTPGKVRQEFLRAIAKTTLTLTGRGSSCGVKVGTIDQPVEELVENVQAVMSYLSRDLPGKWPNILSIHLKTKLSVSIPVYMSTESANDVEMPSFRPDDKPVVDEVNTLTSTKVKVFPSGKVKLLKSEPDGVGNENEDMEKEILSDQKKKMKKKKKKKQQEQARLLREEKKKKSAMQKAKKNKNAKRTETEEIISPFSTSRPNKDTTDGLLRKRKKYLNVQEIDDALADKSFEDSFKIQHRSLPTREKSETADRFELKQIQMQETVEAEAPAIQGNRLRLHSKKRSYAMISNKSQSNAENINTELISFVKKDYVDGPEKEPQVETKSKRQTRKSLEGKESKRPAKTTEVKSQTKSEKKLSRMQSIRQSVRLAKTLM